MRFFQIYQCVVPLVFFPLAWWLWQDRYGGNHRMVFLVLSIPILFAYIIPALGTNWLRLWEFNTRLRIGRFRLHHGFLLGTATSLFALLCLEFPLRDFNTLALLRDGVVTGSVVAFWNWLYDTYAIQVGFIIVYNRNYREGRGAAAIATEYCPVFFGALGFCYAVTVRVCEHCLLTLERADLYWPLFVACSLAVLFCPVLAFMAWSLAIYGDTGLRSTEGISHEP